MSQENVEIVRRQFMAWNAGNLDEWAEAWDHEVEVIAPEGWPDGDVNRGLDAWRRQAQRLRDSWAEARVEIDEIRAIEDRVVVRIRYVTKGADTRLPFEGRGFLHGEGQDQAWPVLLEDRRSPRSRRAVGVLQGPPEGDLAASVGRRP